MSTTAVQRNSIWEWVTYHHHLLGLREDAIKHATKFQSYVFHRKFEVFYSSYM